MMGSTFRRMVSTGLRALGLSALFVAPALAQNAVVRGTVTSVDRKEPIAGVNVLIPELNMSVLTSDRGVYTLTVPAARIPSTNVTVTARGIGFKSMTRSVKLAAGDITIDFALATDINRLEEVIVTGTLEGVERAKVPFSVGRLTAEDLPVPALDPLRALQGKVAGLRIAQLSGFPGLRPEILLRGPTSINGAGRSQEPLIIVDGVINHVGSIQELGGLDIESVEVVKGAAGSSLYGTQAANGVITITTKRGASQQGVTFNVRSEIGSGDFNSVNFGMPINHQLQLSEDGTRFCESRNSGNQNCGRTFDLNLEQLRRHNVNADTLRTGLTPLLQGMTAPDLLNIYQSQIYPGHYYNGLAQITTRKLNLLQAVDATGKVGNVGFYMSGQYTHDPGPVRYYKGSDQKRGRLNLDYNARSDLRISVSTMFDNFYRDERTADIFGALLRGQLPGLDLTLRDTLNRFLDQDGNPLYGPGTFLLARQNFRPTDNGGAYPFFDAYRSNDTENNRFLGSVSAKYFPASWVTFEGVFGYDNRNSKNLAKRPVGYRTTSISAITNGGNMALFNSRDEAWNVGANVTLRRKLANELNGKLRVSGAYDNEAYIESQGSGNIFNVKEIYTLSNLTTDRNITSRNQLIRNAGASVAGNLDYKDRYVLDASIRRDGSSLFGPGNRWSTFSRIAGVWIVSHEPFWKVPFMDEFRLRFSRGTAGSTPRFDAQYETYTVGVTGISTGRAGNQALKPETTTEYEAGADLTLFKKLGLEVTYAQGSTRDQILLVNVPANAGYSSQWQNAGTLQNKTWEIAATLPIINNRSFYWQARGTWDRTRTYITQLSVPDFLFDGGSAQGTGTFFFMTADKRRACLPGEEGHLPGEPGYNPGEARPNCTGLPLNRYGNVYGRTFLQSCSELHVSLRERCGEGKDFQVNDQGWLVWVGAGNKPTEGITKNLWQTRLPATESPWGVPLSWGHPIVDRPLCPNAAAGPTCQAGAGVGINTVIGNALPDFRFTFTNDFSWKRFTAYFLIDGTFGHLINNQSEQWGLLSLSSAYFDQGGNTVETAKPVGYSWRAGSPESTGTGGFYDTLNPNNRVLEKGSFAKFRELSVTYRVGKIGGFGDWTLGFTGRNLMTITGYSGLDPEVGCGGQNASGCGGGGSTTNGTGSGLINQTDAFDWPTMRTLTFTISTKF